MEQMMEECHIVNEKEPFYPEMYQMFEPTPYQIQVQVDYDEGGWIYIKYCPRCG